MKTKHKNILAENMLRFGVKNLTESQLINIQAKLLTEQATLPSSAGIPDWCIQVHNILKEKSAHYNSIAKNFATQFTNYKVQFNICTLDELIAGILIGGAKIGTADTDSDYQTQDLSKTGAKKAKGIKRKGNIFKPKQWHIFGNINMKKDPQGWAAQIEKDGGDAAVKRWETLTRKFVLKGGDMKLVTTEAPQTLKTQGPGMVLTYGVITPTSISNLEDQGQASKFEDVILFINNASIASMFGEFTDFGGNSDNFDLEGSMEDDGFNYAAITLGSDNFVTNIKYTQGDADDPKPSEYIIPQKDGVASITLDGNSFDTNETTLKPGAIDPAIEEVKGAIGKGAQITSLTIESSASANEKTEPNPKTPGIDPTTGLPDGQSGPYTPKNKDESRNAQLAFGRGQVVANALKAAGITVQPTINPIIQSAEPAINARYAKITMQITIEGKPATVDVITKTFSKAGGTPMGEGVLQGISLTKGGKNFDADEE